MKKLLFVLILVMMPLVNAYYWDSSLSYYGQNQYYSVVFDQEIECTNCEQSDSLLSLLVSIYEDYWFRTNWWILLLGVLLTMVIIISGVYEIRKLNKKDKKLGSSLLIGFGTGIVLEIIVGIGTLVQWIGIIGVFFPSRMVLNSIRDMTPVGMIIILVTVLVFLALLIAPSIFVGIKNGLNNGIYCFLITILTLFVLSIINLIVLLVLESPNSVSIFYYF